jgi:hypothetical protein
MEDDCLLWVANVCNTLRDNRDDMKIIIDEIIESKIQFSHLNDAEKEDIFVYLLGQVVRG